MLDIGVGEKGNRVEAKVSRGSSTFALTSFFDVVIIYLLYPIPPIAHWLTGDQMVNLQQDISKYPTTELLNADKVSKQWSSDGIKPYGDRVSKLGSHCLHCYPLQPDMTHSQVSRAGQHIDPWPGGIHGLAKKNLPNDNHSI